MRIHDVYCPDRRCEVQMVWAALFPEERDVAGPGPRELICLGASEACTGRTCPLAGIGPVRMKHRLRCYLEPDFSSEPPSRTGSRLPTLTAGGLR